MKVLTVCLGNICRSPAAQGILQHVADQQGVALELDSAGTAAYHIGKQPDKRSIKALNEVGLDITHQRARQVAQDDFDQFDWILAMDSENLANLKRLKPANCRAKVVMFGRYRDGVNFGEVDDPYYGGDSGFASMREQLFEIAEDFVANLTK
ncbi:low molecular weight protein-tyrosine-phosphatase [Marinomonas ostreistagni]|uniref:low molecular weight protein-tyrosine-phosphatase n=1 Tax=Marinomonas ostreistagni TaxID=359209 RepID=UPI00194E721C|nr:low molecular weight protein-tyrosine-phosphatase [Marinomonas ostreistagni]MBM6549990.1 low molecular weight phosphotyrosine protein phosphatase [Marinomonas ostreistagni]